MPERATRFSAERTRGSEGTSADTTGRAEGSYLTNDNKKKQKTNVWFYGVSNQGGITAKI